MDNSTREQRKAKVIEVLNKARSMELQAITQYMNQHYNLDDMDYGDMAAKMKLIAVDEMRHAEQFAERIKNSAANRPPTRRPRRTRPEGRSHFPIRRQPRRRHHRRLQQLRPRLPRKRRQHQPENTRSHHRRRADTLQLLRQRQQAHRAARPRLSRPGRRHPSATGLSGQGFVARQGGGPAA